MDIALSEQPGPWFLGGDRPSVVDLQYVSHVERMNASVLYWKGLNLRNNPALPHLEARANPGQPRLPRVLAQRRSEPAPPRVCIKAAGT